MEAGGELGLSAVKASVKAWDVLVRPIVEYGAEVCVCVWGGGGGGGRGKWEEGETPEMGRNILGVDRLVK